MIMLIKASAFSPCYMSDMVFGVGVRDREDSQGEPGGLPSMGSHRVGHD